jgi:hypothetical protein
MKLNEHILRKTIPFVINSFNQKYYLKKLIDLLESNGFQNIYVVDNNSNDMELLDYYNFLSKNTRVMIIYYGKNLGPRSFHLSGYYKIFGDIPHFYSDPDIGFNEVATDYVEKILYYSEKYKIFKVGSALELPDNNERKEGLIFKAHGKEYSLNDWESQFWTNRLEEDIYKAQIDTTIHLFNPKYYKEGQLLIDGIRVAGRGYIAKHLPWYKTVNEQEIKSEIIYKSTQVGWNNY